MISTAILKAMCWDRVLNAIFVIVEEFTQYVRKDLWQEHNDAMNWDYMWGIGLPDGCGLSGSDHTRAHGALADLRVRVHEGAQTPPPSANTQSNSQRFTLRNSLIWTRREVAGKVSMNFPSKE